jgi:tetratricopeptide (TPR) repeat protein
VIFRRDGEREASSGLRLEEHAAYQRALAEYFTSLEQLNDRGAAHIARGVIHENHNELDEAEVCYRTALRLEPNVTGARSHLAALMERRSDEARLAAQQAAQRGDNALAVQLVDPLANLQVLSRNWRSEELQLYARDARLAPNNAAVQYRYGLNLYLNDQLPEAEQALRQAIALQPKQVEFLIALALLLEKQGRPREALPLAQQALALWPDDAGFREIVARLGQATSAGS